MHWTISRGRTQPRRLSLDSCGHEQAGPSSRSSRSRAEPPGRRHPPGALVTHDRRHLPGDDDGRDDERGPRRIAPGKVTLTQRLAAVPRRAAGSTGAVRDVRPPVGHGFLAQPVQRRAAPPHDDPFAMHLLGTAVQLDAGTPTASTPTAGTPTASTPTDTDAVHAAAARGLDAPAGPLPHLDRIQRAFGPRHDLSGVHAHVGGAGAEATAAMGATAYATGNHVVFDSAPDLHTTAHEAAHTIQQRGGVQLRGGVGEVGDVHERHADAVADRVVRGESAVDLLDDAADGASATIGAAAIQRQPAPAAAGAARDDAAPSGGPDVVRPRGAAWPVFARSGKPYLVEDRGGKPGFWVVRAWIVADEEHQVERGGALRSPRRAREILTAMGVGDVEFAAQDLTFAFPRFAVRAHFTVGADAAFSVGLPAGREAVVERAPAPGLGLKVTVRLDDPSIRPGAAHAATSSELTRAFRAAADHTGLGSRSTPTGSSAS